LNFPKGVLTADIITGSFILLLLWIISQYLRFYFTLLPDHVEKTWFLWRRTNV